MLDKFKSIFTGEDASKPKPYGRKPSAAQNPKFISDKKRILEVLSDIEAHSPLCSIRIGKSEIEYSTSILGVKTERNMVLLDELVQEEGNIALQKERALKLFAYHNGVHLSLDISDVEIGQSRGMIYYKGAIPNRVYYPQRRQSPRLEINASHIPFHGISERTGMSVSGALFDISREGAGVNVAVNSAKIQRGDKLVNCQLRFDGYDMECDFMVRFFKPGPAGTSKVQIGGLFIDLSQKSIIKLDSLITSLERSEIRAKKSE